MVNLESDSCPGNAEGKQGFINCFRGGARGVLLLWHWPVFPEFAVVSHA